MTKKRLLALIFMYNGWYLYNERIPTYQVGSEAIDA